MILAHVIEFERHVAEHDVALAVDLLVGNYDVRWFQRGNARLGIAVRWDARVDLTTATGTVRHGVALEPRHGVRV